MNIALEAILAKFPINLTRCAPGTPSVMQFSGKDDEKMSAILISEADFESIKDYLIRRRYWENMDLSYPSGYWIPAGLLQFVLGYGSRIMPVVEVLNLPVFFGNTPVDRFVYGERLTYLCRSRERGAAVKGISILPPYWYESQYFEFKRCFRYQEPDDSERCWRIISCKADMDWLMGCWDAHPELSSWLSGKLIDITQ